MANSKLRSTVKSVVTVVAAIAFIFVILFIGLIISQFLQSNEFSPQSVIILCIFIGSCTFIATQTHLLGHYLAGTCFHYERISYNLQSISMIPRQKEEHTTHAVWYYASGILCNLFLGCTLLFFLLFVHFVQISAILWLYLFTLSITWLVTGGIQAVSYFNEGTPSDGKILWGLLFGGTFSRYYVANINLSAALKAGYRPAQLPLQSYKETDTLQSADAIFLLYLYYKALDLQNAAVMLKYSKMLEDNFAIIPQHLQSAVLCELCYVSTLKGYTEQAKSYFSLIKDFSAEERTLSYYRACAYYFFYSKGNKKQALSAVSYALELFDSCEYKGIAAMERSLLQTLLQDMAAVSQ